MHVSPVASPGPLVGGQTARVRAPQQPLSWLRANVLEYLFAEREAKAERSRLRGGNTCAPRSVRLDLKAPVVYFQRHHLALFSLPELGPHVLGILLNQAARRPVGLPFPAASSSRMPSPRVWRAIAALPRPFRRTPGRLSRGYHSQGEGWEINLRGFRPTIFVLHRGRWGTGELRRQPFRDLWAFLQKDLAL